MFRAIAGNFFTKAWTAVVGIMAVPFYARFLGPEAFGIVSFVVVIQSAVNLLDFGLSNSITRQVAIHQAAEQREEGIHTIRTLELVYWAIGIIICLALVCGSSWGATAWLRPKTLSPAILHQSLLWASLAVASLWPMTFYSGALMGMTRYQSASLLNAASLTLRQLGGAAVAWFTSGDLVAFFIWQFVASLVPVVIAAWMVWRGSGVRLNSAARWGLIRENKGLFSGMALSTAAILAFTQLDKIVLSRLLPLSEFGLYSLAWTAAGIFYMFYSPIAAIGLPRFTTLLAKGDEHALSRTYHICSQLLAVGILPTAAILSLFTRPVLALWLHDRSMVEGTSTILQLLTPFAAVGALAYIPAVFQWAHGWTAPTSLTNLAATVLLAPCLYIAYRRGGTSAAILSWGALRLAQSTVQVYWMHRRLLRHELGSWLSRSVAAPAALSLAICLAGERILGPSPSALHLGMLWIVAAIGASIGTVDLRKTAEANWKSLSRSRPSGSAFQLKMTGSEAHHGGWQ